MVFLLRLRENACRRQSHAIGRRSGVFPPGERESGRFCCHQNAAFPFSSITFGLWAAHAGARGTRNRTISDRMSANIYRDTATSAIWIVILRTAAENPKRRTAPLRKPASSDEETWHDAIAIEKRFPRGRLLSYDCFCQTKS